MVLLFWSLLRAYCDPQPMIPPPHHHAPEPQREVRQGRARGGGRRSPKGWIRGERPCCCRRIPTSPMSERTTGACSNDCGEGGIETPDSPVTAAGARIGARRIKEGLPGSGRRRTEKKGGPQRRRVLGLIKAKSAGPGLPLVTRLRFTRSERAACLEHHARLVLHPAPLAF